MYLEPAQTPERALEMIRSMLALPETADAAAVSSELAKVKAWATAGESPAGVDIDGIVGGLRTVLNLPTLTSVENVFVEVEKLLGNLAGTPDALVAALPKYLKDAPNHIVALERAALALVPGAKNLPRHVLYRDVVHPAVAALSMKKIAAASSAGTLRLVNHPQRPEIPPPATVNQKPVLDVTGHSAGRNATERLLLHVKAANPGLNHDEAFAYAMRLKGSHQVVA